MPVDRFGAYLAMGLALSMFFGPAAAAQDNLDNSAIDTLPLEEPLPVLEEPFPVSLADVEKVPEAFHRQEVVYETPHPPGTVIVDTDARYLYLVLEEGRAMRYGIGVGRDGFEWRGIAEIGRKAAWPSWHPPAAMVARDRFAAKWARGMPGGPKNPLGARALYLYANGADTLYRIHGTNQPSSIGQAVSSGCVRMLNADVIDLYNRVSEGSKVVVLGTPRPVRVAAAKPRKPIRKKVVAKEREIAVVLYPGWKQRVTAKSMMGAATKKASKTKIVRKTNFNLNRPRLASQQ